LSTFFSYEISKERSRVVGPTTARIKSVSGAKTPVCFPSEKEINWRLCNITSNLPWELEKFHEEELKVFVPSRIL
jgi:hypothetical protein